ncbi:radical SAM/SPASM domain-containing protein [Cyanobium sp. WAJ14-Wanaka]|uniref:radical SAM/SPASM domain-containing protein n=1 Tax=Cyanobium sp. WAJ14-Wanaka TaxID=2823725 RepID=UPI0020CB8F58|nr:radical SAM/SPASM domain-containing protein [Cyanobium sp. WAJ14-Wanaka]MCP9775681.1 radical SAM protein [Cyanobium sp. WAJ14-Wanaka]
MKITNLADRTLGLRPNLGPQLPLAQPHVLLIDPSSACNLRCKFCPTGDPKLIKSTGRFQGQMTIKTFENIIENVNNFDTPLSILRLYKEGEPLLNKNLSQFITMAKSANVDRVDTTTNGILLNKGLSEDLIASGIDQINVSLNGLSALHYKKFTQTDINVDKVVEEIKYLCSISGKTVIYVKCIKEHLNMDEQKLFIDLFSGFADKVFFEGLQPNWPQFHFNYIDPVYEAGHYGQQLIPREVCPFIFYMMVVNSDGTVSACVQDWNHSLIIGDINSSSLLGIWNGSSMNELRRNHLSHNRKVHCNCAKCPVLTHGCLDNIDSYAFDLLPMY